MTTLLIENLDEGFLDDLVRLAGRNNITVEQQAKRLLEQAMLRADRSVLLERAEAIAAMTPKDVSQTDSVLLLREDRNR